VLEREEETEDTKAKTEQLKTKTNQHDQVNLRSRFILRILRGTRENVFEIIKAQVEVLEAEVQQTARSSEYTVMRWNRETLWMEADLYSSRFPRCGDRSLLMRRADARLADAASHRHRISAVGPRQELHREENSRAKRMRSSSSNV